jgi:protein transport protein SEC24
MRSTMYNVPNTDELLSRSKIPLALVIQPLGPSDPYTELQPVPLVDHGPDGPVRCRRCKAYINLFCMFVDGGRRFQCNLCSSVTEVPDAYFCNLDHTGKRHDLMHRAELTKGTYDFAATQAYCARPPQTAAWIFVIDVSYNSIQAGVLPSVAQAIREVLNNFPAGVNPDEPSPAKFCIITYDSSVHFYNLSPTLAQPQMMIVSDIEEMFLPLHDGLLVSVSESREIIETLLDRLPHMFANTRETEPVLGAALQAGLLAGKDTGGRVIVFNCTLPLAGPGTLKKREDQSLLGTDKERTLYAPADKFYKNLANEYAKYGLCIDLFLFPSAYTDVVIFSSLFYHHGRWPLPLPIF